MDMYPPFLKKEKGIPSSIDLTYIFFFSFPFLFVAPLATTIGCNNIMDNKASLFNFLEPAQGKCQVLYSFYTYMYHFYALKNFSLWSFGNSLVY